MFVIDCAFVDMIFVEFLLTEHSFVLSPFALLASSKTNEVSNVFGVAPKLCVLFAACIMQHSQLLLTRIGCIEADVSSLNSEHGASQPNVGAGVCQDSESL